MSVAPQSAVVWLADGVEEMEAVIVLDVLRRGNVSAHGMAVGASLDVRGSRGVQLRADGGWDRDLLDAAALLVVPGGMGGMETLRADARVLEHLRKAARQGRWLAAICAGPLVLARAGVLAGRAATCYPGHEGELTGARHVRERVVVDGRIVTSQGPGTAIDFAVALVRALQGDAVARSVAQGLLLAP